MNLSPTHNSQKSIFSQESAEDPLDSVIGNGMDFGMKNREGADASQAGTSGGRGKRLPRDHHYPLAPAARPIRAGGCSGCVTSGDPFPCPNALRLQTGGTAERGSTAAGSTWRPIRRRRVGALEAGALWATSGRRRVIPWQCWPWGSAGAVNMPSAAPLWGIRQGRFCPARGSAGAGDRQTPSTCRPAVLLASGIGSNADVLPRGAAGRASGKRCWPRSAAGQD